MEKLFQRLVVTIQSEVHRSKHKQKVGIMHTSYNCFGDKIYHVSALITVVRETQIGEYSYQICQRHPLNEHDKKVLKSFSNYRPAMKYAKDLLKK